MKRFWFVAILVAVLTSCYKELDHTQAQVEAIAKKVMEPLNVVDVSCSGEDKGCLGGTGTRTCIGRTERGIAFRGECDGFHCHNLVVGAW